MFVGVRMRTVAVQYQYAAVTSHELRPVLWQVYLYLF